MFHNVESFQRPASVREVLRILQTSRGGARVVAGGTDLAVHDSGSVRVLVDITRAGLTYIKRQPDSLTIGATTTMAELEASAAVKGLANGILAQAAAACGSMQIRNVATIGGNMVHGSPAADLAAPLVALDAVMLVADGRARRKVAIAGYIAQPRQHRTPQSLLLEVAIPKPPAGGRSGWSFQKLGRTAVDISLVNVAAGLQVDAKGKVKWARIALGAVAPAPWPAARAAARLTGNVLDAQAIAEAASLAAEDSSPIDDHRASADYRRQMCRVLTERALRECAARAGRTL